MIVRFFVALQTTLSELNARTPSGVERERGQSTAEYALVILGAVALGTLLIAWASKSHAISKLFDTVISKILP